MVWFEINHLPKNNLLVILCNFFSHFISLKGQNGGNGYGNGPNGRNASNKWMEMVNTRFFDHFWEILISKINFGKPFTSFL